ncbi:thiamine-phosphate kinase [Candidatus Marsarchaeota archaeon]|nr:thiamine-phosphate kinase [Candidatus Marsarchaeota archaeon]
MAALRLIDLGERRLIERIRRFYGYRWPEDDCFYIRNGKKYLLMTADSMPKSSHIPDGISAESIGYFLAAANISDIAAMGGMPRYFMSALTFPDKTKISYLDGIERGISKCLRKYGVKMAGGDIKEGTEVNLTGFVIGEVEANRILRRTGMKIGDMLCITGSLGKNAAGYYTWRRNRSAKAAEALVHILPRVREGRFISENGATAAMDLSDGVYSAISQLSKLNGIGFDIHASKVPTDPLAQKVSSSLNIPIEEIALNFGGEYELLFTIPKAKFDSMYSLSQKNGIKISCIGVVTKGTNRLIKNGKPIRITESGYEHFR